MIRRYLSLLVVLCLLATNSTATLQSVQGVYIPAPWNYARVADQTVLPNMLIDASGEKAAFIFRIPKTGALKTVGFLLNTVTNGQTLKVSFQDVSATTGDPDGTVDQFRTVSVANNDDNTWKQTGIISSDGTDTGTKRGVTRGDLLAVVIEFDSTVGNLNIAMAGGTHNTLTPMGGMQSYPDLFTTAWTKQKNGYPLLALQYDDDAYYHMPGTAPVSAYVTTAINTGSTPDEVALRFSLPVPVKVSGAWLAVDLDGDADVVLYDSDGSTVLATVSLDKDVRPDVISGIYLVTWSSDIQLSASTFYRLALKPTTATNIGTRGFDVNAAAQLDQYEGGQNFHWSQRTDAGAWSQTTTRRPFMGLIISALDDGAGGGARGRVITQ